MAAHEPSTLDPSDARAMALDLRMRQRLEASLRHIASEARDSIAVDSSSLRHFFRKLRIAPVPPLVFAAYFELVLALENNDIDSANRLLSELVDATEHRDGTLIIDFEETGRAGRYRRFVDVDPAAPFEILPPPPSLARQSRELVGEAFELLDRGDVGLAREIRALLREIVLAAGPESPHAMTFEGASSVMLWGAIVLNTRAHHTRLGMAQALAHESGHNLLFGLCADSALVEDDGDARYPSPLREDKRPMDGIVHATFVCARMHRAVAQLVKSSVLSKDETVEAHGALAEHKRNFCSGFDIVARHGRLTSLGRTVMRDARQYMDGEAGPLSM